MLRKTLVLLILAVLLAAIASAASALFSVCSQIEVGCWVQGEPGVKNGSAIRGQLDNWIALGEETPPTPMIIVIYDTSEGSGSNTNYHIVGFAAFILQSYSLPGKTVTGEFIQWVVGAAGKQWGEPIWPRLGALDNRGDSYRRTNEYPRAELDSSRTDEYPGVDRSGWTNQHAACGGRQC